MTEIKPRDINGKDVNDDSNHVVPQEGKKVGGIKPKKIPGYKFFKALGISEDVLDEASKRYQMGFFANLKFIAQNVVRKKTSNGKVFMKSTLQLSAFSKDPDVIQKISNPIPEVQLKSVHHNPHSIKFIDNPTEEAQQTAVDLRPDAIQFMKEPSEQVQKTALWQDFDLLRFIEVPFESAVLVGLEEFPHRFKNIENPSEAVQVKAVQLSPLNLQYIVNPSAVVLEAALEFSGSALKYIPNPTDEMKYKALRIEGDAIQYIENPTLAMQIQAVRNDSGAIQFISNPTEEMQILAVKNDINSLKLIKDPCNALLEKAGWNFNFQNMESIPDKISILIPDLVSNYYYDQPNFYQKEIFLDDDKKQALLSGLMLVTMTKDYPSETSMLIYQDGKLEFSQTRTVLEGGALNDFQQNVPVNKQDCYFYSQERCNNIADQSGLKFNFANPETIPDKISLVIPDLLANRNSEFPEVYTKEIILDFEKKMALFSGMTIVTMTSDYPSEASMLILENGKLEFTQSRTVLEEGELKTFKQDVDVNKNNCFFYSNKNEASDKLPNEKTVNYSTVLEKIKNHDTQLDYVPVKSKGVRI